MSWVSWNLRASADFGQATFFLCLQHISIFGRYTWCGDTHDEVPGTPSWSFEYCQDDRVRGYEFAKDQYVQFTDAELESLETESSNNIELKEFIPLSKIDPVYFENAYY